MECVVSLEWGNVLQRDLGGLVNEMLGVNRRIWSSSHVGSLTGEGEKRGTKLPLIL